MLKASLLPPCLEADNSQEPPHFPASPHLLCSSIGVTSSLCSDLLLLLLLLLLTVLPKTLLCASLRACFPGSLTYDSQ